ncbi:MAG: FHA domain-containing protein [Chloroflexota bacterium]|nr:FHA domain-containing protein [Chloroflexota bacterium]
MTHATLVDARGEHPLNKDEFVIGRNAPADLVIPLPLVSRAHARITHDENGYSIADLDSRNGTFVNGEPIAASPRRLRDGDEIVIGGAATLRFHDPTETLEGARVGRLDGVWIDPVTRAVWVDGRRVDPPLSAAQFALIELLYRRESQVVSREDIVAAVWQSENPNGVSEEAIDGLIKRLRARLRETQPAREYIAVVRGQGVRLAQPD